MFSLQLGWACHYVGSDAMLPGSQLWSPEPPVDSSFALRLSGCEEAQLAHAE